MGGGILRIRGKFESKRVPIKFSPGLFNPFPMRFLWMKEVAERQRTIDDSEKR